jgi:hypothetical protein
MLHTYVLSVEKAGIEEHYQRLIDNNILQEL